MGMTMARAFMKVRHRPSPSPDTIHLGYQNGNDRSVVFLTPLLGLHQILPSISNGLCGVLCAVTQTRSVLGDVLRLPQDKLHCLQLLKKGFLRPVATQLFLNFW